MHTRTTPSPLYEKVMSQARKVVRLIGGSSNWTMTKYYAVPVRRICLKCGSVIGTIQELGHRVAKRMMVYTHVLHPGAAGACSAMDGM